MYINGGGPAKAGEDLESAVSLLVLRKEFGFIRTIYILRRPCPDVMTPRKGCRVVIELLVIRRVRLGGVVS